MINTSNLIRPVALLVCLFLAVSTVSAQNANNGGGASANAVAAVSGTVVDESGAPLIGVAVRVLGTQNGTVTDADSNFTLANVASSATIEFMSLGYKTIQVKASDKATLAKVILPSDNELLEETVVIGYGVQKKVNLTGSVSGVSFTDDALKSRPVTNVSTALTNAAPGLQIMQNYGRPGNESFSTLVRGIGTMNSSGPLVLVDGQEAGLGSVNPSDIESVSILKDAASCAIYGNRGANGVILVTTRNGGNTGKVTVNYDATFSYGEPFKVVRAVTDYADYMELMNESRENTGNSGNFSSATIETWRKAALDPNGKLDPNQNYPNFVSYPNTDWWDWIYQSQWMQKHVVTVNGREKKIGFNLSFGYVDDPGIVVRSGYTDWQGRANIFADIKPWLRLGARLSGNIQNRDVSALGAGNGDSVFNSLDTQKVVPGMYPYYDGKFGGTETAEEDSQTHNTYEILHENTGYDRRVNLYTNWYLQLKFLKHFTYDLNYYYRYNTMEKKTSPQGYGKYSFLRDTWTSSPTTAAESYTYMYYTTTALRKVNHVVNYAQSFGKHDVTALAGFEESAYSYRVTDMSKLGLLDKTISDLDNGASPYSTTGSGTGYNDRSFFLRGTYAYDSKYLFEADFRADGSSRFAKSHRWGYFPSFSAGWRMSEESWLKNANNLSNLKLRASYGKLGNNSVGYYAYQSTYLTANYAFDSKITSGIYAEGVVNESIEWENTAITNLGVDLGFFADRLTASVDVYDKFTDGILYAPAISSLFGNASAPTLNLAQVDNKGIEMEATWKDNIGKDLFYTVKANFSYNKNKVVKYKGKLKEGFDSDGAWQSNFGDVSSGGSTPILEDHMLWEWYLPRVYSGDGTYFNKDGSVNPDGGPKDGMIRTPQDMEWLTAMMAAGNHFRPYDEIGKSSIWYGDYILADRNGDGIYGSSYDNEFLGTSTNPKYNFGFQASLNYKSFDFSMNWGGCAGFSLYYHRPGQNSSSTITGYTIDMATAYDHYFYDPENPSDPRTNTSSNRPRLFNALSNQNTAYSSTLWLYKGDFLKLRNLTIGYSLPKTLTDKVSIERVRFFASGDNLFALTQYPGMDPEQRRAIGYSTVRRYTIGLNVTF